MHTLACCFAGLETVVAEVAESVVGVESLSLVAES